MTKEDKRSRFDKVEQGKVMASFHSKLIFSNEEARKEWESADPKVKKTAMHIVKEHCKEIESKMSIEILCQVILDLEKRIEILENK